MASPSIQTDYEIGDKYPRGFGVIIVNTFKYEKESERRGADVEVSDLRSLFYDLGLEIKLALDLSAEGMNKFLTEISKENSLEEHCVLVVAISSHGGEKGILGASTDGEDCMVSHKEIVSIFSNDNCPALTGKPKVFVFNSCRGNENTSETERVETFEGISEKVLSKQTQKSVTTSSADIFKIYSCLEGSVSLRKPSRGSLFLSILCELWRQFGDEMSLADIVTQVNGQLTQCVYRDEGEELAQCCVNEGTLRAILRIGVIERNGDDEQVEKDAKKYPIARDLSKAKKRTNSFFRMNRKKEKDQTKGDPSSKPVSQKLNPTNEEEPEEMSENLNQEAKTTKNDPIESVELYKPAPTPAPAPTESHQSAAPTAPTEFHLGASPTAPTESHQGAAPTESHQGAAPTEFHLGAAPTEFHLGAAAFDGINTVYLTDLLNARIWCCDIIRKGVSGYIYDPVFDLHNPVGIAADERVVIVTCGSTKLLAFGVEKLTKVKEFEHLLANFSAVDINNNEVIAASNALKFSVFIGTTSLEMKPMEISTHGSDLSPEAYLTDIKSSTKYIFLLFNDKNNPLCVFSKLGEFLFMLSPQPAQYKYFAINHLSAMIMLGEETSGVIRTLDLNNQTWMEEVFPEIEGSHLAGITLLAPSVLFAAVNTDKPSGPLEHQCLLLHLHL